MIWIFVFLLMVSIEAPGWLYWAWLIPVGIKILCGGTNGH